MRRVRSQFVGPVFRLVVVALVVGCVLPAAASALPKALLGSFGAPNGPLGGQLVFPRGVAVNQSGAGGVAAGSVYVAEGNTNHRISQFTADGEFVRAWGFDVVSGNAETGFEVCTVAAQCKAGVGGATAVGAGQLNNPQGIAVDQDTGFLYVTSATNRRVDVFSATGQFAGAFGWGVDTGAAALEFCTSAPDRTCQAAAAADAAGGNLQSLNASIPSIDPSAAPGTLYVPDVGNARVSRYSTTIDGGVLTGVSFVKAFGWDVVSTGPGDDATAPVNELENCVPANGDVCKVGVGTPGGGSGQFGPVNNGSPTASAVDSTGAVYVASGPMVSGNCTATNPCRIQKFAPGTGSATNFGPTTGPGQIYFESGASTAVAALSVAVDPSNDHVYVLRRESNSSYKVLEFDSTGTYIETHPGGAALAGATNNLGAGLAVGVDGRVYANLSGGSGTNQVNILGPVPDPIPTMVSVTDVGSNTATFDGTVEIPAPGSPTFTTRYHFEYSSNGIDWTSVPVPDAAVADGSPGVHNVTQTVTGLQPNTLYQARLVASTGNAGVPSNTLPFTTDAVAPRVAMTFVDEVTQTQARLGAHIDPEGLPATYHFEWGTEPCSDLPNPCTEVPAFERPLGDGNKELIVNEAIDGLQQASHYYYRVVATNSEDTTNGPDETFETLNHCNLPDNRCYELVSPVDKGPVAAGGDHVALGESFRYQAAADGTSIAYMMSYGLPDATSGNEVPYLARRTEDGWSSRQIAPPATEVSDGNPASSEVARLLAMPPDLGCGIYNSVVSLGDNAPESALGSGYAVLYRSDLVGGWTSLAASVPTGSFVPVPMAGFDPVFKVVDVASSPSGESCDRITFHSQYRYGEEVQGAGSRWLYSWTNGNLAYVGVVPGLAGPEIVEAIPGASNTRANDSQYPIGRQSISNTNRAVSEDGSRVFFTAISLTGGNTGQHAVFRRDLGSPVAEDASQSQTASLQDGTSNTDDSVYWAASKDGSDVFFTGRYGLASNADGTAVESSDSELSACDDVDGTGCDLYRYSFDSGKLTDVSVSNVANENGASVVGVIDVSDDGEYVYFVARGQLVSGKGKTEAENLAEDTYSVYVAHAGEIRYVGAADEEDTETAPVTNSNTNGSTLLPWGMWFRNAGYWTSRVTPEGKHLLYQTDESQAGYRSGGQDEAYLYDYEQDAIVCVSCRHDGKPQAHPLAGDAQELSARPPLVRGTEASNSLKRPLALSDDGRRVFFYSYSRLATGGTEGRIGLYQWEEGQVTFIASSAPALTQGWINLAGASSLGNEVFFSTTDRYTAEDVDGRRDIYVAKVGGGFDPPESPPELCDPLTDGSCRGSGASEVNTDTRTSGESADHETVVEPRRELSLRGLSKAQLASLARGRRVPLAVRVSAPGRVLVRGTASIGGLRGRVFSADHTATGAGVVRVPVVLSRAGRKRLASTGRLRVELVVRLDGAPRAVTRTLVLRSRADKVRRGLRVRRATSASSRRGQVVVRLGDDERETGR